jgi:RNA polymerase sigma factor (sigma-70 family)
MADRKVGDDSRKQSPGSATLVKMWCAGDSNAAGPLKERYWNRLYRYASSRLGGVDRAVANESDVAQEAFFDFLLYVKKASPEVLDDRERLWKTLATIAFRKASSLYRDQSRSPVVRHGDAPGSDGTGAGLLPQAGPSQEYFIELKDIIDRGMALLNDRQREIVDLHLQGFTVAEIATLLDLTQEGVRRRLRGIQKCWSSLLDGDLR